MSNEELPCIAGQLCVLTVADREASSSCDTRDLPIAHNQTATFDF